MSINTKCSGEGCNISNKCLRFTQEDDRFAQRWFVEVPGRKEKGKWVCHKFIQNGHGR